MKIKTRLTVILLAGFIIAIIIFVTVLGKIFLNNQRGTLDIFKNELLQEKTSALEESAELFFQLIDSKLLEGASREKLLDYVKRIDQLNRSAVVFDYRGRSLLEGHSLARFQSMVTPEIITGQISAFTAKNTKNFHLDNYPEFLRRGTAVVPRKIYFQLYNSMGLVIGYGKLMQDIKNRMLFLERRNRKNTTKLFLVTFIIIILGVLLIIMAALIFTKKTIFAPLESLIESFRRVSEGEVMHRVDVTSEDEMGRLTASFNSMTDKISDMVIEIRAANIKLDSHSRELENRVARRTGELTAAVQQLQKEIEERKQIAEDLRSSRVEAEAANRAKSQFLANMSHEIRTPMNGILGMSELLQDTTLTLEQEEYVNTLKGSAESLLCLLNDILDLSRIEVGKLEIENIDFNLRETMGIVAKNLFIQAQRKKIELIYDIGFDIPDRLMGDPGRLRQVLTNLIGNAVKFTEKGVVVVKVRLEDEAMLHFTVSDTGIGISREKQKLIFDKFTQSDSSITRKFGGSGLGLAISRQLVQLMGGRLWVCSPGELEKMKPGCPGSSFHFTLRCQLPEKNAPASAPMDFKELKKVPVLVVDDNPINRKIFEGTLKRWGMAPTLVESGEEALAVLDSAAHEKKPYRLVLMDIQMPHMDGFETIGRIRKKYPPENVRIIVLTSAGTKGDGKRCRELGVAAYLKKPVPASDLLEAISIVMGAAAPNKEDAKLITRYSLGEGRKAFNVLVAEDNPVNRKLIKRILEKRGYLVNIANNGKEALDRLEEGNYDLVLMDIQMPVMDGMEATRLIRKKENDTGGESTPIIALTAHAMKGDKERFLEAGMDNYLSKPIKQTELMELLDSYVRKKISKKKSLK